VASGAPATEGGGGRTRTAARTARASATGGLRRPAGTSGWRGAARRGWTRNVAASGSSRWGRRTGRRWTASRGGGIEASARREDSGYRRSTRKASGRL
jgi:hypothetical protein